MSFEPLTKCDGKEMALKATDATTFVKNKLVKYSSGYLTNAAAADDHAEYLCLESKLTTATGELVQVLPLDQSIVFRALTSITPESLYAST